MKTLLISDSIGLGIMEVRPEPAWRVRLTALRNKDLLAPDYGAMHVAAYLKGTGHSIDVINLVADVHDRAEIFQEPHTGPDEMSGSLIGKPEAAVASREYLMKKLVENTPDVVLLPLSVYNLALYSRKLLADIKDACPDCLLVTGGIYATFHAEEILGDGNADIVVRGEGEHATAEILDAVECGRGLQGIGGVSYRQGSRVINNRSREPIRDLDSLPHLYTVSEEFNIRTRFDLLSELNPTDDYIPGAGFLTSRGCPEACAFCLDPAINNRRTRFHSPQYVRNVLDYCAENFTGGSGGFFFGDATFTMNKKHLRGILEQLGGFPYTYQIQTRADYLDGDTIGSLARCGFTAVAIGAESFNERILQDVAGKRLRVDTILDAARSVRRSGMQPVLTFIVGLPGESRESIERTVDILKQNELCTATFFPLVVFQGTALFDVFRQRFSQEEMETLRLNPMSEEFLFTSDDFPTRDELTAFTQEANRALIEARVRAS
jgi:anaerobic magnesium-protoporphyrin IX monomethyl ester cyclase